MTLRPVTSASNIARRALCPGSERLEAGCLEDQSEQAREGQLLHAYGANPKLDRSFLTPYQRDLLEISDQLDEQIFARVREHLLISSQEPFEDGLEKALIALEGMAAETPGHCDRYRYWPRLRRLVIIDRKYGYKVVTPAAANYQLRVYAIAGSEEWGVQDCIVAITQPRLPYDERITIAGYSAEDIDEAIAELILIRKRSADPNAPLVPGDEQCRYCTAKIICPAFREAISGLGLTLTEQGTLARREGDAEAIIAGCSDEQLARMIDAVRMADFVEDMVMDEARTRIANGKLTSHKLGKASQTRHVTDVPHAVTNFILSEELTMDELLTACGELYVGRVEKLLREKKKVSARVARNMVEEIIGDLIEKKEKKQPVLKVT